MNITVTISDLGTARNEGSMIVITGTTEGGDRITFAGPRSMGGEHSGSGPESAEG